MSEKAKKMTLDEYLGTQGCSFIVCDYMLDKLRIPHGLTLRQQKKMEKDADAAQRAHALKRRIAIFEYEELVVSGKIIPKTRIEQTIETARGNSDNESVQAARRILIKRGIDWRGVLG